MKLRLHSSGAASRLAALLVAHIYTDMLVPRALPAGRVDFAARRSRCHAGFHHGLLGECLPRTEATVLKVSREYLDAVTGQRLPEREEFVEALSHDCWVVQVPLLAARRRTDLERLLSVFDQELQVPANRSVLEVDERQPRRADPPDRRRVQPRDRNVTAFEVADG